MTTSDTRPVPFIRQRTDSDFSSIKAIGPLARVVKNFSEFIVKFLSESAELPKDPKGSNCTGAMSFREGGAARKVIVENV